MWAIVEYLNIKAVTEIIRTHNEDAAIRKQRITMAKHANATT